MGWRPSEFWAATMTEFFDGVEAFNEMHGTSDKVEAPSDDEMAGLLARYG